MLVIAVTGETALAVALIVGVVAPVLSYITANRKLSGKIATSEAADLWAESQQMRTDLRTQLGDADKRLRLLEERVTELERLNTALVRENSALKRENRQLTLKVESLEGENQALAARIDDLEEQLREKGVSGAG